MASSIAGDVTEQLRRRAGQGQGSVDAAAGGVSVSVDVEDSERYAAGVRGISARPERPVEDIRRAAEDVAAGVPSLGEPLSVVEVDSGSGRAVVRSSSPDADDAGVTYWEADVRADETTLRRYRKEHAEPEREAITEPMPHATAGKIAGELAEAVGGGKE